MRRRAGLLRYVRPHRRLLAAVFGTAMLGVVTDLLGPWPLKLIVDQVLQRRPIPAVVASVLHALPGPHGLGALLFWVCLASVVLFVASSAVGTLGTLASVVLGQRMTYDLGADLFLHLQRLSLLYHARRPVGDSIKRVTGDAYCAYAMVSDVGIPLVRSVVELCAMFVVMWMLQPSLTLLSLIVAPFLAASMRWFGEPMRLRYRATRDLEGQLYSTVEQTLNAIPAVQAFTREEHEQARFRGIARANVRAELIATLSASWFELTIGLVTAVGSAAMLFLGAHYVMTGTLSIGSLLVFVAYLRALYDPLNTITHTATGWQRAAADADRVLEVLETAPDVADAPDAIDVPLRGFVRYVNVGFGHEPGRLALQDISFEARPGDVVAIVGATGAGKTTLVNLLVRFFDPATGSITVDGHDLRSLNLQSLRRQVAIVLQDSFIFPLSVAANISFGRPEASLEEIETAARRAGAGEFIDRLPDGYETVLGERGATLSGGEKQRLSIARAFLKDAPILILDEPTSALDTLTEKRLLDTLDGLMVDRTTFVVAHRLSTVRNANRILVLDHGRLIEEGTHDDLMRGDGVYARLARQGDRRQIG